MPVSDQLNVLLSEPPAQDQTNIGAGVRGNSQRQRQPETLEPTGV